VQKGDVGLTPSQIIEKLGIPNATLSFHLKELLNANLLLVERQSRNLIYRPNADLVTKLILLDQIENLLESLEIDNGVYAGSNPACFNYSVGGGNSDVICPA
jgi:DNA-binding transcriptional ArsR family regulator